MRQLTLVIIAIIWFIAGYKIGNSNFKRNARNADVTIDMYRKQVNQLKIEIERYRKRLIDANKLVDELTAENQGYRKVVEKWQLQQDSKNKDHWG